MRVYRDMAMLDLSTGDWREIVPELPSDAGESIQRAFCHVVEREIFLHLRIDDAYYRGCLGEDRM